MEHQRGPAEDGRNITRAKNVAYRFLATRPRSRAEIEAKLHERKFDDATIDGVLASLVRLGYVNDRQFADQWSRSRIRLRGFGRRRIEGELRNKGINRDTIQEVLAEVLGEVKEIETAKLVAKKKLNTMRSVDRSALRRRLAGFLERKGFSFEIIRMVLTESADTINKR